MSRLNKFTEDYLLVRLWRHLESRRRRQFFFLFGLMLISAISELLTLAAVLPFLGVLTAPERVHAYPAVAAVAQSFGITSAEQLLLPITLVFVAAAMVAGSVRITFLWMSTRLAFGSGADISLDIYRRTLYQSYSVHISRNSSEVISGITYNVATAVSVLNQVFTLISSLVLMTAITIGLFLIDFKVALFSCFAFGGAYGLLSYLSQSKLKRNSQTIASEQTQVVKALQEGLGGIRDVLLDGTQPVYCDVFRKANQQLRRSQGDNIFLAGSPRYAMESIGMVLIAIFAYSLSTQTGGAYTVFPVLGALALGAQRLLPVLQQAYNAWATIRGSQASLASTIELLDQPVSAELLLPAPPPLKFTNKIEFADVCFKHSHNGPWVIQNVSLEIRKGSKVAFVGNTGSGKSTTLDLIMGLVSPVEGHFLVDGQMLNEKDLRAWQRTVAHVPQSIFLADATIAQNIALGVPIAQINMERVRNAAALAQIAEFFESQHLGYETIVGERGVRLSGGQRQRIGIARALYKDAEVLVFDEATSALDNTTEHAVMQAIQGLGPQITIIMIAHRLSTIQECDKIFEIKSGRIVAQGTYEELLVSSSSFRQTAASVVKGH